MRKNAVIYAQENFNKLKDNDLIKHLIKVVEVNESSFTITLKENGFEGLLAKELNLQIKRTLLDIEQRIEVVYQSRNAYRGAIKIELEQERSKRKDLLSLEPNGLKLLVMGVAWRDKHFEGASIKTIAEETGYSPTHVRKTIKKSFDTLMSLAPSQA